MNRTGKSARLLMGRCISGVVTCVLLPLLITVIRAAEEPAAAGQGAGMPWIAERQEALSRYRFQLGDEEEALALEPRSILNWSNAERATEKGGVFLWTYQGRPQLIAC